MKLTTIFWIIIILIVLLYLFKRDLFLDIIDFIKNIVSSVSKK